VREKFGGCISNLGGAQVIWGVHEKFGGAREIWGASQLGGARESWGVCE
jgi:hypothetical protein